MAAPVWHHRLINGVGFLIDAINSPPENAILSL
jgi:hypothetical protein